VVETLTFRRAAEVVPVNGVTLNIEPVVPTRDDTLYVDRTAEQFTVSWEIEGEADTVDAALLAEGEAQPLRKGLKSGDAIDRALLEADKTYTLKVSAVPKNGAIAGSAPRVETLNFQLYPEAQPITGLALDVTGGELKDGAYRLKSPTANLAWHCDGGDVDHYALTVKDDAGNVTLQQDFGRDTTSYDLTMDKRGNHQVSLAAIPRYALADTPAYTADAVVEPHIPGFVEKYWPFLAGGLGLLAAGIVALLMVRKSKGDRITGVLRVQCPQPGVNLNTVLVFNADGKPVKPGETVAAHPTIARYKGQKVYDLLNQVQLGKSRTNADGKVPGVTETGNVKHRPNTQLISLTYTNPQNGEKQVRYVGKYDIGVSPMTFTDADGAAYTFTFSESGTVMEPEEA
jgi:hypothetical protein